MSLRKIVQESIQQLFEAHKDRGPFKGMEILSQFPFSKLADVRANVNWGKRDVEGWGSVQIPSLSNGDALGTAFGQDDVIDFIDGFIEKYGEEPIFMLYPNEVWYNKIKVVNPEFVQWREDYGKSKQAWLDSYRSKELSEGVRDKEPFEKITFGVDLLKVSGTERKGLMDTIKYFNGEKLKTDKDGVWHTYVPVDDVEEFLYKTESFSPERVGEIESFSKFKSREKNLKDGQKVTFLDYSVSESNPPMATGYLKPGFIGKEKSLLKWTNANGEEKEDWVFNRQIDAFDHYHRDPGTVTGDNIKVEFGVDTNSLTDEEKEKLKSLVKSFGGRIDRLFGKKGYQSSGGKNYAIFKPDFKFDEFYQDASEFDPYFAETEKGGMIAEESTEEEIVCEVRRIVRNILKNNVNKK